MAALTMAEALRSRQQPDPTTAGVIKTYMAEAPVLQLMRWKKGVGGKVSVVRWKTLPTSGWRALNAEFTDSAGETEKIEEDLYISGGRVIIDDAIIDREPQAVPEQEMMQVIAHARNWNTEFYKGSGAANNITGIQSRITGSQLIDNGTAALDLNNLNNAILNVRPADKASMAIIMGTGMESILWEKANDNSGVRYVPGDFGGKPATYNGIRIVNAGLQTDDSEILDFSEGAGTNETSIYVVSFDPLKGVVGAQTTLPKVKKTDENSSQESYKVQWDSNFQINTVRSAYRISGITNASIA